MVTRVVTRGGLLAVTLVSAAGCLTLEDGKLLRDEIQSVRDMSTKNEQHAERLARQMDEQLKRLRQVIDEATKVVTRNSADVGQRTEKLEADLGSINGRIDDIQHSVDAITKQFQDYRAASDTKLEQLTNELTAAKNPPTPQTPDALYSEAEKRYQAGQYADARRLFDTFINRNPTDARAAKAQFHIGEAYNAEKKYANAIGAYTKVVENFPKSEIVPEAMFKNGLAFYALKYCSDAKVYFQELLRRYPKTSYKSEVNEQLRKLQKDLKNKSVCAS